MDYAEFGYPDYNKHCIWKPFPSNTLYVAPHTAVASCCIYIILVGCKNNYFGTLKWESTNTELCLMTTRSEVWLEEDTGQVLWKAEGIQFVSKYGSLRRLDRSQSPAIRWGIGFFFWLPFATHYRQIFSNFFKRFFLWNIVEILKFIINLWTSSWVKCSHEFLMEFL